MSKLSEQVAELEKRLEKSIADRKNERAIGGEHALYAIREKSLGLIDGTAKIAQKHGVSGPASYALADEVFDLIKHLMQRHAKASAEDVK